MSGTSACLSKEQQAFLDECKLEFSDRFSDADLEFKKIYDLGIPTPPIMCPWYTRRFNNRDRAGGSRSYNDHREGSYNDRRQNSYDDRRENSYGGHRQGSYNDHRQRYRPY